jgi:terminase large subunit-like protein
MLRAGRRGGKTVGVSILAVIEFLKGRRVLYAVPTGDQIARFWHEIVLSLAELIEGGIYKKYESDKIIERTGTEQRIRAKTAWNADTLRGDTADLLILDEFQLMNEDAWGIVGLPMLMDNNGDAVLVYTPPSLHSRSTSKALDKRHAAKLYKEKQNDPAWLCLHWTSHDNPHISETGIQEVAGDMTALAVRQEIMAEDIEEVPGALWKQELFDMHRVSTPPAFKRIVIGVDPSGGSTTEVGIVAAALGIDGHGYILRDSSLLATTPKQWAAKITWDYSELKADRVCGETNYGGDMVETTIKLFDENMSYKNVTASRGKLVRAEPICALYEKGYVHHVGESKQFEKLEEECCSYVPGDKHSPNRMDAMVWAMTELFPENQRLALVEQAKEEQAAKVQTSQLIKPATNGKTEDCPVCHHKGIVKRGPISHCTNCGEEWGTPKITLEFDRPPRYDLLK